MSHFNSAAFVAVISQFLMAVFGVDYYAMLWAFVGALVGLGAAQTMTRVRAVVYVLLSTLIGAALASGGVAFFNVSARGALIGLALVCGAGSHVILTTLVRAALARIQTTLGGDRHDFAPSSH